MAPGRADLWGELAQHEFRRFQRFKRREFLAKALTANEKALDGDVANEAAVRRALRMSYILGENARVDSLCTFWEQTWPGHGWPYLVRGMLLTEVRAWNLAWRSFQQGLHRLDTIERRPFYQLGAVDPQEEEKRREAAPDTARFFEDYWRWQDPTPAEPVNPRLVEHYARMVQAELMFALDHMVVRGWEHSPGEMIVRYGIDDSWSYGGNVRHIGDYRVAASFAAPRIEVSYGQVGLPIVFTFVDYNLSGRFFNPIEAYPRDEDFFLLTNPTLYHPPMGMPEFAQEVELWRFVDQHGRGRIEVAAALSAETWPEELLAEPYRLATRLALYDPEWNLDDALVASWAVFERDDFGRLVGWFQLEGSPDSVIVGLQTSDRENRGRAAAYATLSPRAAETRLPLISDIAFLTGVDFEAGGGIYSRGYGSGLPNPGHRYHPGQPIGIGFEAYGLTPDKAGLHRVRLRITVSRRTRIGWLDVLLRRGQDPPRARLVFDVYGSGEFLEQLLSIQVPSLDPGEYRLQVEVTDLVRGTNSDRIASFTVIEKQE